DEKPNTNTGAEGIALVAGIAVIATGAVVVSKKRK
ncbi:MAG: NPXTG-anchored protein, partial [Ruminiclostridium sp.]|nr:NPXTG-anchored protein [Ruminiclostridium sp.]